MWSQGEVSQAVIRVVRLQVGWPGQRGRWAEARTPSAAIKTKIFIYFFIILDSSQSFHLLEDQLLLTCKTPVQNGRYSFK